ncbi:nucleoside diphosphate kinase homolog 5-like [Lycorma delicatula]|uniref:nucleoside diphosphate kinase homolog 5-like n=1 Tax=Lycorma delicatula TaxID=130591 RepID=UPI003F512E54
MDHYCNSLTSSTSSIDAGFQYVDSETNGIKVVLELTLAIIKPEAVKSALIVEKIIRKEGFKIIKKRMVHLTPEQASEFYLDDYGKTTYPKMVLALSAGPIIALCLAKKNAVEDWKTLLGPSSVLEAKRLYPNCLRAHFGCLNNDLNGLHGSDTNFKAEIEIHFFFPKIITYPVRTEQERIDYLNETLTPTLTKGLVELCKRKPAHPMLWLADWLLNNNPYQPKLHAQLQHIPT